MYITLNGTEPFSLHNQPIQVDLKLAGAATRMGTEIAPHPILAPHFVPAHLSAPSQHSAPQKKIVSTPPCTLKVN